MSKLTITVLTIFTYTYFSSKIFVLSPPLCLAWLIKTKKAQLGLIPCTSDYCLEKMETDEHDKVKRIPCENEDYTFSNYVRY